jgi:hypothetical protein
VNHPSMDCSSTNPATNDTEEEDTMVASTPHCPQGTPTPADLGYMKRTDVRELRLSTEAI